MPSFGEFGDFIAVAIFAGSVFMWAAWQGGRQKRLSRYNRLIHLAKLCRREILFVWLKRGSRRALRILSQIYGKRHNDKSSMHRGYLSPRSFIVSTQLATIYLTVGALMTASVAIIVAEAKSPSDRVLGLILLVSSSGAIFIIWKRRQKLITPTVDRLGALISAALLCVGMPMVLQVLDPTTFNLIPRTEPRGASTDVSLWMLTYIFLFFIAIQQGLGYLHRAYGYTLPIGLIWFILISGPVYVITSNLASQLVGSKPLGAVTIILLLVLTARATLYQWIKNRHAKIIVNALTIFALIYPFVPELKWLYLDTPRAWHTLLKPKSPGEIPIIAYSFMLGLIMSILASLAYANAVCDWASVAITRRLLVALSATRQTLSFIKYLLLDIGLAIVLVIGTYVLFSLITHAFFLVFQVPAEAFLSGLRSIALDGVWTLPIQQERDWMYEFGHYLAKFVGLFALTAVVPTVFHLSLLVFLIVGRAVIFLGSIPAEMILRTIESSSEGSSQVPSDPTIDSVMKIGGWTTFLVGYVVYRLVLS